MGKELTHSNSFGYSKITKTDIIGTQLAKEIGGSYTKYREAWDKISRGKLQPEYPVLLNIELSPGCNLQCGMCLTTQKDFYQKRGKNKITFEKYKEILDEGYGNGLSSISLNGFNEPLLLKNIAKYIKYAKDKNIPDIYLSTNGILMKESVASDIVDAGLTRILISIDAITPETYQKVRGRGYEKVVHNVLKIMEIKKQRKLELPIVRVAFVRSAINHLEEKNFIGFWNEKVDQVIIQNFSNGLLEMEGYEKIEEEYRLEHSEPMEVCYQPFQRLLIVNNGDVYPCCSDYGQRILVGNIYQNTVKEIWNKKEMKLLRETVNGEQAKQFRACYLCRCRQSDSD